MAGKLGIGIYTHGNAEEGLALAQDAAYSGARLCLLFRDALPLSTTIAARNGDILIIGRPDIGDVNEQAFMDKPEDELRSYVQGLVSAYPKIHAWAIFCEQVTGAQPDDAGQKAEAYRRLRRQVRAELILADELHKLNRGLVACNAATGTYPMVEHPDQADEWARIIKPLTEHPGCWLWGLHVYGTPGDAFPGAVGKLSEGGDIRAYYALRYRSFCDAMTARGVVLPPIAFTEYGQCDGWREIMSEEDAKADLLWFGGQIADDPRVFGGAEFLHGNHDPSKWAAFDSSHTDIYPALVEFNRQHPAAPSSPLPAQEPVNEPDSTRKPGAPTGIGWWIWYLSEALNGRTPEQFAAVCKQWGITHLYIKTSDGANFAGWKANQDGIAALRAAGLSVYSWSYHYGNDPQHEAEAVNEALRLGVDGHVLDIESECEGKYNAIEWEWQIIRTGFPDAWVGYAPLPVVDYHDPALYEICNRYADAVLPQFYSDALGEPYTLEDLFARWERWARTWGNMPELLPIGQAYGTTTPETIGTFVRMCRERDIAACSFWEWTAANSPQWGIVMGEAREWSGQGAATPAVPEPTPEPIDWQARCQKAEELLRQIAALATTQT